MKIKFLFAALVACAFVCMPAQAQDDAEEPRHEIAVSYGAVPNSIWIDVFSKVGAGIFGESSKNDHYVGPLSLEYYYHTSPLVGVGAVAIFASNNEDSFRKERINSHKLRSYYTLLPSVKFNWLRKNSWGLYSKVAVGASVARFSDQAYNENGKLTGEKNITNDVFFNFQASLIGVEAGNQQVRGFAELGVGEQGIILGGVRYKF